MDGKQELELDTVRLLIKQARDGDVDAKSELATQVQSYLTMMADRGLSEGVRANVNPSDVVQHTLIRMMDGIGEFRGNTRAEFFGWLKTIVQNESARANRHYRTQKRDVTRNRQLTFGDSVSLFLRDPIDEHPTPQTNAISQERIQLLHELLEKLPADYAEVIVLRNLDQLSFREIGETMDRSEAAANKLWKRAIERFQLEMGKVNQEKDV